MHPAFLSEGRSFMVAVCGCARFRGSGETVSQGTISNPKLKLMDQVREVMQLVHYSLRTKRMQSHCDGLDAFKD